MKEKEDRVLPLWRGIEGEDFFAIANSSFTVKAISILSIK
jgi:hypothetical protein